MNESNAAATDKKYYRKNSWQPDIGHDKKSTNSSIVNKRCGLYGISMCKIRTKIAYLNIKYFDLNEK